MASTSLSGHSTTPAQVSPLTHPGNRQVADSLAQPQLSVEYNVPSAKSRVSVRRTTVLRVLAHTFARNSSNERDSTQHRRASHSTSCALISTTAITGVVLARGVTVTIGVPFGAVGCTLAVKVGYAVAV